MNDTRRVFWDDLIEYDEKGHIVPVDTSYIVKGYPLFIGSDNWLAARKRMGLDK